MHKLTDGEKREKRVMKVYRNCFMTQIAFIICVIALAVLATPAATVTMLILFFIEILYYGYSVLLIKITLIESALDEKGIVIRK